MMGGKCKGRRWVRIYFEEHIGADCGKCHYFEDGSICQVLDGREPPHECPALQEYLDFESVPVPSFIGRTRWG
jgi:hypothetical protein